jgi:hypothetical protein
MSGDVVVTCAFQSLNYYRCCYIIMILSFKNQKKTQKYNQFLIIFKLKKVFLKNIFNHITKYTLSVFALCALKSSTLKE